MRLEDWKKIIIDIVLMIVGSYLVSLSINMFMLPNKITTGGASGVATILYYLTNINISMTVFLINLPLFVLAIIKLGFKFTVKSIFSTGLLILFLEIFKYDNNPFDLIISSIFGGMLLRHRNIINI